jgi:hypothetical protein
LQVRGIGRDPPRLVAWRICAPDWHICCCRAKVGVSYEEDAGGRRLRNLRHARICAGAAKRCVKLKADAEKLVKADYGERPFVKGMLLVAGDEPEIWIPIADSGDEMREMILPSPGKHCQFLWLKKSHGLPICMS